MRFVIAAVLAAMLAVPAMAGEAAAEKVRAAFVLLETIDDQGWTQAHYKGIKHMQDVLGDKVEVAYTENIHSPSDAERVIRDYAAKGYDIVFGTTFAYMEPMLKVAREFPDTAFEHCSGYKQSENMGNYFGRMYQTEYLAGYMSGLMGYKDVGTVATQPIPEPIRGIDAFTIGLRKGLEERGAEYDADKLNTVVWLNSWRDPINETTLAETLVKRGHDLIRQMADTPDSSKAACAMGTPAIGYGTDAARFGADCALVSTLWNWGPFYVQAVRDVLNGQWEADSFWGGLDENIVELSPFHGDVPRDVRDKVMAEVARIEAGEVEVFAGPVIGQDGQVLYPEGESPSDKDLLTKRFFIKGVDGKIPQ
ncbi:BMP family ABC transporter substrate-binding protein [Desulfohalovibrio reitneri]|uniref:BMP family ABC transporter substrate-binding protein n=1 Tax=Desulfohalovibrio reitneri TaxID=1307759 RepID=UPI0004A77000|nr:BMP family ABC transporter substrate-binding protein [Desulfohalovibrio reitneri]